MIIHTSDFHIGAFSGKPLHEASLHAFEEIAEYAVNNGINHVVVSGDLFEYPRIENYRLMLRFVKTLKTLRDAGVYVVATPGSHDHSPVGSSWLNLLNEAGLIHVPRYEELDKLVLYPLRIGDYVFYGLPGFKNNLELAYLRGSRVMFKGIEELGEPIILIAHTSVEFAGYRPEDFASRYGKVAVGEEAVLKSIPGRISYVALGHIHFPIPLFDEAEASIAYSGAPIGRDVSDLRETLLLKEKYGRSRRFLLIDLSGKRAKLRSVWRDFGVSVEEYSTTFTDIATVVNEVKAKLRDMSGDYRVLLLRVDGIGASETAKLLNEVRSLEKRFNTAVYVWSKTVDEASGIALDLGIVGDIEELEERAIREAAKRLGLHVEPEKLMRLISLLGRRRPEGSRREDFYTTLFNELKPLLEEIVGGK